MLGDWAEPGILLPDALAEGLIGLIEAGFVPAGATLPPQRALAAVLGVSRATVVAAQSVLDARGYLIAVPGSGSRVRSAARRPSGLVEGRLFSFTNAHGGVLDLSTGALPASSVVSDSLDVSLADEVAPYLDTDGYFPAGLPVLRQAVAEHLTRDGIPTQPQEVLITAGAQQATFLALRSVVEAGDRVVVEDPTYRGALEALKMLGARIEGVRHAGDGVDVELVDRALSRSPGVLYCQTSIHNPTGQSMSPTARAALAASIARHGTTTVEDCCSYDLTLSGTPAATLASLVDPDQLINIGTLSKLFWGGLRVGWIRASQARIRQLLELRKVEDLATSVVDQLHAVRLLRRAPEARSERRRMLTDHLAGTERSLREHVPGWSWRPIRGGSGLWVDTGTDALALAETAKRVKVKLAPGRASRPMTVTGRCCGCRCGMSPSCSIGPSA